MQWWRSLVLTRAVDPTMPIDAMLAWLCEVEAVSVPAPHRPPVEWQDPAGVRISSRD